MLTLSSPRHLDARTGARGQTRNNQHLRLEFRMRRAHQALAPSPSPTAPLVGVDCSSGALNEKNRARAMHGSPALCSWRQNDGWTTNTAGARWQETSTSGTAFVIYFGMKTQSTSFTFSFNRASFSPALLGLLRLTSSAKIFREGVESVMSNNHV